MNRIIAIVATTTLLALLGTSAHAEDSELRKLIKQSDALFEQRKFDEFLDVNKKAMALIESAPDQKPAEVAEALNNAAIGFQRQKDLGKAEALFKRSLEMAEQAGQADTAEFAVTLFNLAELYRLQRSFG